MKIRPRPKFRMWPMPKLRLNNKENKWNKRIKL